MAAIALIGPDGAGKTTLTRMLERSKIAPFKYLYMGIRIPASNVALPTSRLVERFKGRSAAGQHTPRTRPRVLQIAWSTARLGNRLAEEWYRQLLSWYYQRRGFT
ncbi:MAG TPA: hypothetical protein VNK41_05270, partial [Vicinamibacterales bacterium]|nr:hypothetical protein [Vicinamibacterales bacterium]